MEHQLATTTTSSIGESLDLDGIWSDLDQLSMVFNVIPLGLQPSREFCQEEGSRHVGDTFPIKNGAPIMVREKWMEHQLVTTTTSSIGESLDLDVIWSDLDQLSMVFDVIPLELQLSRGFHQEEGSRHVGDTFPIEGVFDTTKRFLKDVCNNIIIAQQKLGEMASNP
ncbi:hypothetical protein KI387_002943, partial [Taxus chinensis]